VICLLLLLNVKFMVFSEADGSVFVFVFLFFLIMFCVFWFWVLVGQGWTLLVGEVCSCSKGTAFDYDDG